MVILLQTQRAFMSMFKTKITLKDKWWKGIKLNQLILYNYNEKEYMFQPTNIDL